MITRVEQPLATRIAELMPELKADLVRLARIPSIAFPGFPPEPVGEAHALVVELLAAAGVARIEALELPDTPPVVFGEIPAPDGAPTVLLYAHYDVQPAGDESLWETPPFEPTEVDGAIYGRGIADDKSNILVHLGAIRAFGGRLPVGLKIVVEGREEYGSPFDSYPLVDPDRFRADAAVIGDAGNIRPGVATLTVALRGYADVLVEARTLAAPKHSGEFGGPAPDALTALVHALATLHDEHGDVAVAGLRRDKGAAAPYDESEFRALAEIEDGVPLVGTGTIGERMAWGPAITIAGIDAPPVEGSANVVVPYARARVNLRVHPEQSAAEAQTLVCRHLEDAKPFGISLRVSPAVEPGNGFAAELSGPAYEAARAALATAWGGEPTTVALGGSIPFVSALHEAVPDAEILLFGAQDGRCNLHAPNERVLLDELERAVVAEAEFFRELAARRGRAA
ncbi:MAG TPA: M20/M25/M40 family metallo-hydrolase [Gaiellaceae bacterium]|nr:M20/M25/M40 family metallo-hydrolase [Gaiellaceae bacterium]